MIITCRREKIMRYSISFVFDEMKAAQAACYILSLNAGQMDYMK